MNPSSLAEAAAAWAGTRRVRVGGAELRYREAGRGTPLVLVHGLGVSSDYWFRNAAPLAARGMRVLAPDLPGFGRSGGSAETVPAQAEALLRWAEELDIGPAVYLGHSLGAQTVLELAARYPEQVRGVLLAGPTGAGSLREQLLGLCRDIPREPPALIPLVAQAYLLAGLPRVWRTWTHSVEHHPLALLSRIRVPGWVLVGEDDPVVDAAFADALAAGLPAGRLVWIARAAHALHFDQPEAFNRTVATFLRMVIPGVEAARRVPRPAAGSSARGAR